jgi:hypothetical protein
MIPFAPTSHGLSSTPTDFSYPLIAASITKRPSPEPKSINLLRLVGTFEGILSKARRITDIGVAIHGIVNVRAAGMRNGPTTKANPRAEAPIDSRTVLLLIFVVDEDVSVDDIVVAVNVAIDSTFRTYSNFLISMMQM